MIKSQYFFKLLLIGDGGVGKTALAKRYLTGSFYVNTKITIGADFYSHRLELAGASVTLQIWDFGGEEQFQIFLPGYCKGARGAIFLFDVTSPISLYHLDNWVSLVRKPAPNIPILAAGTKIDLLEDQTVSRNGWLEYCLLHGAQEYLDVSAKDGINVNLVFEQISKLMITDSQTEINLAKPPLINLHSMENE